MLWRYYSALKISNDLSWCKDKWDSSAKEADSFILSNELWQMCTRRTGNQKSNCCLAEISQACHLMFIFILGSANGRQLACKLQAVPLPYQNTFLKTALRNINVIVNCFIVSDRKNIIIGVENKGEGDCVNCWSANCSVSSVQSCNSNGFCLWFSNWYRETRVLFFGAISRTQGRLSGWDFGPSVTSTIRSTLW